MLFVKHGWMGKLWKQRKKKNSHFSSYPRFHINGVGQSTFLLSHSPVRDTKPLNFYTLYNRKGVSNMVIKIMDLFYEDGYTTKQIARLLKINETLVLSVLGM